MTATAKAKSKKGIPNGGVLREVVAALRYAVSRRDLLGSHLADLSAMIFAYPNAMLPFLAAQLHAPWYPPWYPQARQLRSGAVAAVTSVRFSLTSGGLACVAGVIAVVAALPAFRTCTRPA